MKRLLINNPKQLSEFSASAVAQDLYTIMEKMRDVVLKQNTPWANYSTLQDYARICFWAIRKIEYGFTAGEFVLIEDKMKRPLKVLDVGCGVVPLNNWIAKRGHQVVALDPLYEDISFLVKNNLNQFYETNVNYLTAAGEGLPFPDQYFDIVTSVSVLEHTIPGNDRVILDEMARVLKPNGHLLITFDVSPPQPLQEGESALPERFRSYPYPFHPHAAHWLFRWLSRYFNVEVDDLPSSLFDLTWDQVHAFWEETQIHDGRESARREYLALGLVLSRNNMSFQWKSDETLHAFLEGQTALAHQMSMYQYHADRRLETIKQLQQSLDARQQELQEAKQQIVNQEEQITNQGTIIRGFHSSHFFWLVNGPLGWLPGLRPIASRLQGLRRLFLPKVGVLEQYPAKPISIPTSYNKFPDVTPDHLLPYISVVTPSYNQGKYIERTIRSVLDQGYPHLEYVIQDGNSKDNTLDIIKSFQEKLYHFESRQDDGQAHAINLGFQHTSGEIMAYLNSDDVLLPGTLRYVADYFTRHQDMDVVYGHRVIIDENDQEIGRWVLPPHDPEIILWADYIPQETLFWRRSLWDKIGGSLDESYRFALDWNLIIRFHNAGAKFRRLPRFLGAFRLQAEQKTSVQINSLGLIEMNRLRNQIHGRDVSLEEINKNIIPYLKRSLNYHRLYRLGILRY